MWKRVGQRITTLRETQGLTQADLAEAMGVHRTTVVHWENGVQVPLARLEALAAALRVESWRIAADFPGAQTRADAVSGVRPAERFLPPYPVVGTVDEMRMLGGAAEAVYRKVAARPAVNHEMQDAIPRDSPLELLASYHPVADGAQLEFRSPLELGCEHLVVVRHTFRAAGHLRRHCLVLRQPAETLVLIPQVSIAVVSQSRERRPDFLALLITSQHAVWADVEIDGRSHIDTANDDTSRALGLGLPRLGYPRHVVTAANYTSRLLRDLHRLAVQRAA
ncbi:MAG: helix-turn-helix transcriptional regulator [Candidatus Xenobia bacterium]